MQCDVHEPIGVMLWSDESARQVKPHAVVWRKRLYPITTVGLRHTYRQGRTLFHAFTAVSDDHYFRLLFNTETLSWTLSGVADGETN